MEEERDALTLDPTAEPEVNESTDDSAMARLRELRRKSREGTELTLPVPGYEGELGVRYEAKPRDELKKLFGNSKKDDVDFLLSLCKEIVVKDEDGEWQALTDENGQPLGFDQRLAEYLGLETSTARQTVEGTFNVDLFPLAVSEHSTRIVNWLKGADPEADLRFLGE